MLTVHWPQCLDERGVMLVVDSSTPYSGAEVFMMEKLQEVRASSGKTIEGEGVAPVELEESANADDSNEQNGKIGTQGCLSVRTGQPDRLVRKRNLPIRTRISCCIFGVIIFQDSSAPSLQNDSFDLQTGRVWPASSNKWKALLVNLLSSLLSVFYHLGLDQFLTNFRRGLRVRLQSGTDIFSLFRVLGIMNFTFSLSGF